MRNVQNLKLQIQQPSDITVMILNNYIIVVIRKYWRDKIGVNRMKTYRKKIQRNESASLCLFLTRPFYDVMNSEVYVRSDTFWVGRKNELQLGPLAHRKVF